VGVDHEAVPDILARARTSVPAPGAVRRIFINLARRTPPGRLRVYGPRLVPTYNYFQTAVVLAADGFIDANDVAAVAESLAERAGFRDTAFENSLADLVRRGIVAPRQARRLTRSLVAMQILPRRTGRAALLAWWRTWRRTLLEHPAPPPSVALDYDAVLAAFPHLERGASAHKE
jgi:hypothetical protein